MPFETIEDVKNYIRKLYKQMYRLSEDIKDLKSSDFKKKLELSELQTESRAILRRLSAFSDYIKNWESNDPKFLSLKDVKEIWAPCIHDIQNTRQRLEKLASDYGKR